MPPESTFRASAVSLSRRAFLGVSRAGHGAEMRPPWALAEAAFQAACTRCDACITACPTGLLLRGGGAYPIAEFTPGRAPAGCTFCADCVDACRDGALQRQEGVAPWDLRAEFADTCLTQQQVVCRTCGEICDTGAIRFPPRLGGVAHPVLDTAACSGCAACLADCPTQAIRIVPTPSVIALRGAA